MTAEPQRDGAISAETEAASTALPVIAVADQPVEVAAIQAATAPSHTPDSVTEAAPAAVLSAAEAPTVRLQTIAMAYRDYTRKSFEEAQSFVDRLSRVRSLDKALEVQADFAKQACETFAADSRKIRQLYGEFISQAFNPFNLSPPRRDR